MEYNGIQWNIMEYNGIIEGFWKLLCGMTTAQVELDELDPLKMRQFHLRWLSASCLCSKVRRCSSRLLATGSFEQNKLWNWNSGCIWRLDLDCGFVGFEWLIHSPLFTFSAFWELLAGRYRGVLVPFTAGETVIDFRVQGESIVGSPRPGNWSPEIGQRWSEVVSDNGR